MCDVQYSVNLEVGCSVTMLVLMCLVMSSDGCVHLYVIGC